MSELRSQSVAFHDDTWTGIKPEGRKSLAQLIPELSNFSEDGVWLGIPRIYTEIERQLEQKGLLQEPAIQEILSPIEERAASIHPSDQIGCDALKATIESSRDKINQPYSPEPSQ